MVVLVFHLVDESLFIFWWEMCLLLSLVIFFVLLLCKAMLFLLLLLLFLVVGLVLIRERLHFKLRLCGWEVFDDTVFMLGFLIRECLESGNLWSLNRLLLLVFDEGIAFDA